MCQHCGAIFERKRRGNNDQGKRFCSRDCAFRFARQRSAFVPLDQVVRHVLHCAECGDYFLPDNPSEAFCSGECRATRDRRKGSERDRAMRAARHCACKVCGAEFVPEYGDKRRAFCSAACTDKAAKQAAKIAKRTRRLRIVAVRREYVDVVALADAQGWKCGICGKKIDKTARAPDAQSLSLDHVIPLALGGEHSKANCQAAHFLCNSRKGARLIASEHGQLALTPTRGHVTS